ncbi:MAG: putative Na+/H+ antiporter, partial [Chthoniobacterales bacterium]|nr:putative Na+/H+ antiporter [Chthoniobacterales bacterium]
MHTFFTAQFRHWAHEVEERHRRRLRNLGGEVNRGQRAPVSFWATILHFLGEVEAVFGIWLVPLFLCVFLMPGHGWMDAVRYVDSRNFTEPIFVVCIMAIASSQPILEFARICLRRVAVLFGGTPLAWWFSILTIAPLLGSFITEPAAMTIGALLLRRQFYQLNPSMRLRYATLGLLFVNVSVGGTLTHFAAPPVLMVASTWHWNLPYMFTHFGWKAVIGIVISNLTYALLFRREFAQLAQLGLGVKGGEAQNEQEETVTRVPVWVIGVHLFFLAWTVVTLHHPAFFVYGFLFFLAFTQATEHYQSPLSLRGPVLVGFFLASLVVHGGLQGWWISVLLANLSEFALFVCSTILTAFNDNAAITYLASQVPAFSPDVVVNGVLVPKEGAALAHAHALEYAVVVGAVTGGGLTVIANAPNPAGQNLLQRY